jgi:hypothetical protein
MSGQRHVPATLPPGESLGIHCRGSWLGPGAGLDGYGCPHRASNPRTIQNVAKLSTHCCISVSNPKRCPGEMKPQLLTPLQRTHQTGLSRGCQAAAVTSRRCELIRRRFSYTGCVHTAVSNTVMYGQATHCSTPVHSHRRQSRPNEKEHYFRELCTVVGWVVSHLLCSVWQRTVRTPVLTQCFCGTDQNTCQLPARSEGASW